MFSSPLYTPNPKRDKNILISETISVLDLRNAPDQCYFLKVIQESRPKICKIKVTILSENNFRNDFQKFNTF